MCDLNIPVEKTDSWDRYFYGICRAVSANTKCFSRCIGAILVRDKSMFSSGYNGPPRGVPPCDQRWYRDSTLFDELQKRIDDPKWLRDFAPTTEKQFRTHMTVLEFYKGKCPRKILNMASGEGIEWCPAGHAEENAILNAARMGIETKGSAMYMTCGIPCVKCMVKIINAGVEELIVTSFNTYDVSTDYLVETGGIKIRLYDFLKEKA